MGETSQPAYWKKYAEAKCPKCGKKPNYIGGQTEHLWNVRYILENGICFDCDK